jgi:type II secretory pathway component PulC
LLELIISITLIIILIALVFFVAYLHDKTLKDIREPITKIEKEIARLKNEIALEQLKHCKKKKTEGPIGLAPLFSKLKPLQRTLQLSQEQ